MSDGNREASERAKQRADWPLHVYPLGQEPGDDLSASTTPEERLAMMWPLALEAWALTGKPLPEYSRATMPVRVVDLADIDALGG